MGACKLSYSEGGGTLAKKGDKAQRWGGQKCDDTMMIAYQVDTFYQLILK